MSWTQQCANKTHIKRQPDALPGSADINNQSTTGCNQAMEASPTCQQSDHAAREGAVLLKQSRQVHGRHALRAGSAGMELGAGNTAPLQQ